MARRRVKFLAGHYYHVYNRGTDQELIFRNHDNYLFLLRRVKENSLKFRISVIVYCLMPNHYHFLLRQDGEHTISKFVQGIFNSYTKAFNKAFTRNGTLFEGPFKSVHVDNDIHLVHLCRYIHRNPLEAGLVVDLIDWPYSNYLEWVGMRAGTLFDQKFVTHNFPSSEEYDRFVLEYYPSENMKQKIKILSLEK